MLGDRQLRRGGSTRRRWRGGCVALGLAALSCGARSGLLLEEPDASPSAAQAGGPALPQACPNAPQCVTGNASDPCGPAQLVDPQCDALTRLWHCPDGARPYQRARAGAECSPLHDGSLKIEALGGSLARFPTDDGRCLWVAETLQLGSGVSLQNVAFEPDLQAPFGTCPSEVKFASGPATSVLFSDGSSVDPAIYYVQITGGFRSNGATRVTYRLFNVDRTAVFGVTELGTGLGYWDATTEHILIAKHERFAVDLDYGNASWVDGDYAYLWGCNAPGAFFAEGCVLGRRNVSDQVELYTGAGVWSSTARASSAAIVFDDGPWISSVQRAAAPSSLLLHVFASDFGDRLQIQNANRPEGPWADPRTLAPCARPTADVQSFCAGPVLHAELADPTRPGELVVSYGVASTGIGTGIPDDYWSRLTWLSQ